MSCWHWPRGLGNTALHPDWASARVNCVFRDKPCGPPWWRRTLTAPASMSRPPMTSIFWTRNCSALEIFALNGVALKSASTRTLFARSPAKMDWA